MEAPMILPFLGFMEQQLSFTGRDWRTTILTSCLVHKSLRPNQMILNRLKLLAFWLFNGLKIYDWTDRLETLNVIRWRFLHRLAPPLCALIERVTWESDQFKIVYDLFEDVVACKWRDSVNREMCSWAEDELVLGTNGSAAGGCVRAAVAFRNLRDHSTGLRHYLGSGPGLMRKTLLLLLSTRQHPAVLYV